MTQSRLTELMTGKTFDSEVISRDRSGARPVLEVSGLARAGEYEDIDLTIRAGEVVGLTGLIGAGRTELGLSLFGMTRPDRGTIRLNGTAGRVPLQPRRHRRRRRLRLGGPADARPGAAAIDRRQHRAAGARQDRQRPRPHLDPQEVRPRRRTGSASSTVKIGRPEDAVSTLSGGNQQRIVLAKWLATEPKLLILDSPTVGVDVGARAGLFAIVRHLAEQGLAILLISDEVPEVYFNADRIIHMAGGRFIGTYDPGAMALGDVEKAVYA